MRLLAGSLVPTVLLLAVLSASTGNAPALREESPPFCAVCGHAIEDDFVEAEGETYHQNHFVCEHCARPLGSVGSVGLSPPSEGTEIRN